MNEINEVNKVNEVHDLPLATEFCKFGDFVIYTIGDAKTNEIDTKKDISFNKNPNIIKFKGGKSSRNILKIK